LFLILARAVEVRIGASRIYLFLMARAVEVRIGASKIILRVSAPRSRLLLYRLLPALLPVNLK
jgi:hypothetical protein